METKTHNAPKVPGDIAPVFRHSVPVARTEVWEEEPSSARLRWHRAYIPHYYSSTPLRYRVEMQEAGGIETEWRSVATDITTPDFTVKDISPKKDYRFRIRAQMENGDISEPTPPIQYYRTRVPMMRDRENALADFKPVEYKAIFLNHPYYDQLTKYVPPSMPINKPDLIPIDTETIELSWRPAIVAEAIKGICNLTYTIEVRCPPSFEWRQLVTGLKTCSHTAHKLHPRIDYVFRVRAWNEYGSSEAGLPVSLYRPQVFKREDEEDDEDFEREWELKYGTKVPPKLPIDTPRIVTQSSESVWFTWLSARLPAYAKQTNINYVVEIKEPPSTAWQRDVTGLVDCQYVKEGLNPNQEYHIRVRAETEFGASDPTMSIILRGKGSRPGSRRSSVDREDLTDKIDLSYLENVVSGVPPRMASTRPLSSSVGPDCLTLSWSPCRTPSYVKASNITYIIEKREPPGNIWTTLVKDIKSFRYDITGLNPDQDYMFRVRAKNDFGLSDPTLPMTLYRDRDDYVPQRIRSRSSSRDSISMLVSKVMRRSSSTDYGSMRMEDDRSSEERIPCQPQYFTTYDIQYGAIGKKGKITLEVRGYPLPTVHWYLGEEKIDYGGRFNAFVTPAGSITLEIKNVGLDTIGQYKCYAENASGAAVKLVTFELAEPPTVLETIKDQSAIKGDSISLKCRVDGFPTPTIKWVKDWRPLADCTRVKMVNLPPETYTLEICSLLEDDEGLYACTVENIAGKVTVVGRLKVEIDSIPEFEEVNIRSTPIEERYHVLEEIGRGRHGVVRRVVEVSTGRTFAANFMSMRNKAQKSFFLYEYEVLRSLWQTGAVLKLYDAFETDRSLIFVTEILTEPELLEKVTSDGNWTEVKVAAIIRKLLAILQELSLFKILHLDIKPSNIRMAGTGLDDIKLIGFGMSRILQPEEEITHNYGSVGYASPEQVTNEVLTSTSDLFSVGVLAYILLSGNGPFQGSSEIEILNLMSECNWSFEGRGFEKFSKEGLDFISRLLVKDSSKRMSVEECINHTWMSTESAAKMNTEQLKQFYNAEKLQRETEKVFTSVQLQSFAKIIHGAKALYQPAVDIESGEIIFPDSDEYGDYLDEDAWYEWQLQYLDDPDSQIYPVQDKNFTVRECRHAGAPKWTSPKEVERSDKDILDSGTGLMFRDKIQPTTFLVGEDVTFTATVVSETGEIPVVTWYRDEQLLSDDYRADAEFNFETGFAKLTVVKSKDYDAAVYKCVARVKDGRVSCEARLLLGDKPSKSGRPYVTQASGTEAFLTWTGPASDGNAYLLGYRIDYRKEGDKKWTQGPYVTEEYALLTGLEPDSTYIFRVSGHNKYGASPFSWSSLETKTLGNDAPKVSVAVDLQPLMQFSTFDKQQLILPTESRRPSLTIEEEAKINESDPNEKFSFADTISKGSFGEYKLCTNKTSNRQCVAKIMSYNKDNQSTITAEFELLCTLRQTNLVIVLDSYLSGDQFYVIYEFLSGINIVQYLCLHKAYKEETVARIVRQVLDALQYLEHYGIIHLNLQPSSIVMATRRRPHVKLRDFTMAHKIEGDKGVKVPLAGFPDFTAPEVIKGDNVTFTADIWTLGALTFTMLSGISAFGGKSLEETLSRILFDRYSTKEMYDNVSKESVKFVIKLMSRLPRNRPTVTKCINSHWLNLSESMVNARNSKMFKSEKLRAFSVDYLAKRGNIDYNLAFVDIEKLPKITSGPLIRPILSDRITNRLEYLLRTRIQTADLTESLKTEAANLPKQPLIEKIVSKIERDTKVDEKNIIEMKEEMANKDLVKMTEDNEVNEKVVEDIKVQESEIKEKVLEPKLTDTERIEVLEEINANNIEIKKLVEEIQVKDIAINKTVEEKANEETKIKEKLEEMKVKDSEIIKMEQGEIKEKMENIKTKDSEINTKEIGIVEVEKSKIKEKLEEKNSKDIESNKAMEEITNVEEIEVKKHVEETEVRDTEINEKEEDISNGKDSEFMDSATNVTDTNVDKVEDITAKETGIIKKLEEETTRIDESEIKEIVENKNVTDTEVQEKTEKQYVKCTEIKENTEEPKVKLEESVVKISEKPEEKDNNVEITEKEKHKMPTDTEIMVINQVKDTQVNENVEEMKVTGIEVKDKIDNTMAKDTETKETTGDNSVKDDTIKEVVDGTRNTEIKTAVEETKHEDRVVDNADTNGIPAEIVEDKGEIQHIEEEEVFEDALETLGVEDAKSVETDVSNVTKTVGENANEVNNEKIEQPTSTQTEIVKNDNAVEVVEEKAEESKKDISEAISNENIDKAGEAVKAVGELAEQKAEEIEKADLDEIATAVRQSEEGKGSDAQTNTTKEQSPSTIAENITTPISKSSKEEPVQEKEENADQSIIDKTEKAESVTDGLAVDEQSKSVEDEAKAIPHMKEIADSKCEEVTEHSEMIKEQVEETETLDIFNKQAEAISIETESVNKSESAESIDKSEQTESIERSEQNESVEKSEQTASVKMSEKPESIEQSKIFGENNAKEPDVETKKSETVLEETRTGTESKATSEKEKEEVKVTANEILSEQQLTCEDSKTTEMKVEKDSVKPAESKEVSLKEAESEKLSANKETVSMINVEEKVASVSEKLVDNVVMSVAETDTAEAVTSEHVMEKHQSISASIKEESVSEVVKQVEGTEIHETATAEKHVAASKFIPTPGDDETSMLKEEISVSVSEQADGTSVKKVSVTQKHETLITDGDVSKSTDMAITSTLLQEENIEGSSSTFVASSETSTMISEKREETLVSGNAVSTISETTEPVSSSATEDSVVEPAIASNLETAKVTESRETVREFVTNDSEIEQMKKELLEDMGVTSAECGKFLMGSHEDISAIIEKIEIKVMCVPSFKPTVSFSPLYHETTESQHLFQPSYVTLPSVLPDEEEIEKVATNRFIDDALMFC